MEDQPQWYADAIEGTISSIKEFKYGMRIQPLNGPRDPVDSFLARRLVDEMIAEIDAKNYEGLVGASPPRCACGDPIPYGARFCIKCGAPLKQRGMPDMADAFATINQALGIPATGVTRRLKAQE